jgi:hypothetical protein
MNTHSDARNYIQTMMVELEEDEFRPLKISNLERSIQKIQEYDPKILQLQEYFH